MANKNLNLESFIVSHSVVRWVISDLLITDQYKIELSTHSQNESVIQMYLRSVVIIHCSRLLYCLDPRTSTSAKQRSQILQVKWQPPFIALLYNITWLLQSCWADGFILQRSLKWHVLSLAGIIGGVCVSLKIVQWEDVEMRHPSINKVYGLQVECDSPEKTTGKNEGDCRSTRPPSYFNKAVKFLSWRCKVMHSVGLQRVKVCHAEYFCKVKACTSITNVQMQPPFLSFF